MSYKTKKRYWPFLFVTDVIGGIVCFWPRFKKFQEPKRIVLLRLEHVGDVLLTTPAFRAIRKRFPKAKIDVLVRDFSAGILKNNKNIDNVIVWNAPWLSNLGEKDSWPSALRFISKLRKNKYDLAFDFHGDPHNIMLASRIARYRVGFGVRGLCFLLNKSVPYGDGHVIDRNLALAKALGADVTDKQMDLPFTAQDASHAESIIGKLNARTIVCIAPGSAREEKNWLNDRWAKVADYLVEEYNAKILFTGGKKENAMIDDILSKMKHPNDTLNICGQTSLTQLAAILKRCSLILCPDSGTMHIARAMNTPLIGLFTVENAREWGYNEGNFRHIKKFGKEAITVEDVLDKIKQLKVLPS